MVGEPPKAIQTRSGVWPILASPTWPFPVSHQLLDLRSQYGSAGATPPWGGLEPWKSAPEQRNILEFRVDHEDSDYAYAVFHGCCRSNSIYPRWAWLCDSVRVSWKPRGMAKEDKKKCFLKSDCEIHYVSCLSLFIHVWEILVPSISGFICESHERDLPSCRLTWGEALQFTRWPVTSKEARELLQAPQFFHFFHVLHIDIGLFGLGIGECRM